MKLFFLLISLSISSIIISQNVFIPDANFKAYLVGNSAINSNSDTEIQVSEATAFNGVLDCSNMNISSLTGIEEFTSIISLNCKSNQITSLDISNNIGLGYFYCDSNQISFLDLSQQVNLVSFSGEANLLTSLNAANGANSSMQVFSCQHNPNLACIKIDAGYNPHSFWIKDGSAAWNSNCNTPCYVHIPDANFKAYLVGNSAINTNGNTEIECSEASAFTGTINCGTASIEELTGIEAFTNLTVLLSSNNPLNAIDLSQNTALSEINFLNNNLTSIDLSNNTQLSYIEISGNTISSLDVSPCVNLTQLWATGNGLSSLTLPNSTSLTTLILFQNSLTTLDLSTQNSLVALDIHTNNLTNLNVANGNNLNFTYFKTTSNPSLSCIQVDNVAHSTSNWTNIDASSSFSLNCSSTPCTVTIPDANFKAYLVGNTAINTNGDTEIQCNEASAYSGVINITSSSIADLTGIENFINLKGFISTYNPSLTNFDFSSNTGLTKVNIYDAPLLTSVDLSNNTSITNLRIESCYNITLMNISNCTLIDTLNIGASTGFNFNFSVFPNLKWLNCYWTNPPTNTFDFSNNTLLEFLDASYNANMGTLDLNSNTSLKLLNISNSNFTNVNYSYLTSLEFLNVRDNNITSLDVTQNTALTSLYCDENQLTSLNINNNSLLEVLTCSDNQITTLDITNNTQLTKLNCSENSIQTINLTSNSLLENLDISSNLFTNLSLPTPNLLHLNCSDNNFSNLDISQNASIISLFCNNNELETLNVANGNNSNFVNPPSGFATPFWATGNSSLTCINVDDAAYSTVNWTNIDATASFSEACTYTNIQQENKLLTTIFPNPTEGLLNFETDKKIKAITIQDLSGKSVAQFNQVNTIDISNLPKGIYIAKVQLENEIFIQKVIKK